MAESLIDSDVFIAEEAREVLEIQNLVIYRGRGCIEVGGVYVHLTNQEYRALELLALMKGIVVTKEMFMAHLYGDGRQPGLKILDVFICRLRKKIKTAGSRCYIHPVWGRGYMLSEDLLLPDTIRWVARRKAEMVKSVNAGHYNLSELGKRHGLSEEEFRSWERSLNKHGPQGLRATRLLSTKELDHRHI